MHQESWITEQLSRQLVARLQAEKFCRLTLANEGEICLGDRGSDMLLEQQTGPTPTLNGASRSKPVTGQWEALAKRRRLA